VLPILLALTLASGASPQLPSRDPGLRIVVIAGEDAVNVVQQKTAVAPVVEVRDRNDNPVAGAVVRFAIRSGRATFGSGRTISVTTDLAGRAAAGGFAPTGTGLVQINVTASFQGQAAVATISQTNVATAAQAAATTGASGGAAGGGGATAGAASGVGAATGTGAAAAGATATTAAAAGAGGGLSVATTAAIVGGAVGGGAFAAKEALGSGGSEGESEKGTTSYTGSFSGQQVITFTNINPALPPSPCTVTILRTGTATLKLKIDASGSVTGTASGTTGTQMIAATCANANFPASSNSFGPEIVTGTINSITISGSDTSSGTDGQGAFTDTNTHLFVGALSNGVITASLTLTYEETGTTRHGTGSVTMPMTLH
jgi:hypothetical protein